VVLAKMKMFVIFNSVQAYRAYSQVFVLVRCILLSKHIEHVRCILLCSFTPPMYDSNVLDVIAVHLLCVLLSKHIEHVRCIILCTPVLGESLGLGYLPVLLHWQPRTPTRSRNIGRPRPQAPFRAKLYP
jgi:hypothetical protein